MKALRQILNNRLILEKEQRVIEFNQETCLKLYIDMDTELRTKTKKDFEKDFLKLMNNFVFRKI